MDQIIDLISTKKEGVMQRKSEYQVDELDIAIIEQLLEDGRKSFTDIAAELSVSRGTIRNRVNRMREDNILEILGWVNPLNIGLKADAHIHLTVRPAALTEIVENLIEMPEVTYLAEVMGDYSLYLDVIGRDLESINKFIRSKLKALEGILKIEIAFYTGYHKVAPKFDENFVKNAFVSSGDSN